MLNPKINADDGQSIDPISMEIIHGKLLALVNEMGIAMQRTSMSPVIYEVLDFACGLCDTEFNLIAQTNGITLFTGTFSAQLKSVVEEYEGQIQQGDIYVTNDPYRGGTHACDFAIIRPIFSHGVLVAYALNVAHWVDIGGAVPGSLPPDATSVFQEGLRLSRIRLAKNDILNPEIVRIITENTRLPEIALGDLNAQMATVRIAESRLMEIIDKYELQTVNDAFQNILVKSEQKSRATVLDLPDGIYTATDIVDGDGVTTDPINVQVKVTISGERIIVDFTGCPPAVAGPINCGRGALSSAVKTVFKALVAPHEPSNEGWFRPLEVIAPSGTIFTAEKPSPTGWYYEGSVQASELVWKALASLLPERFSAGSYSSLCVIYLSGHTQDGEEFIHIEPTHGGWGACQDRDGANAVISLTDGDTFNYSIELLQAKFPLRVKTYALNVEGGVGAGRYRGGYGIIREYEILADNTLLTGSFGRNQTPPWGIHGGQEGSTNRFEVIDGKTGDVAIYGRLNERKLFKGDVVRIITGGGGGWGNPSERPESEIKADIDLGLLSAKRAYAEYGYKVAEGGCDD
ncbi:MAG: hydantoinase B/oxoprolinase family protein [Alphaproteobacteria bacterium]|nr:hydantoinase B/oxoprolinase family protein [Alphaproteobacteria bacterium]